MGVYYQYDHEGQLLPHTYIDGDIVKGIPSQRPDGKYVVKDGKTIRIGEASPLADRAYSNSSIDWSNGVQSPTDGKYYTNESAYMNSIRAAGCVIAGNDAVSRPPAPKTEKIDWKQAVKETLRQTKLSPTKKGKKR